ncbi:MAG: hypothetical protein AAB609_03015 [Patescibacteria group bacterium]
MFYLKLPLVFLKFWYTEAPFKIVGFFASLNDSVLQLLSLPLLVRTYFRPWKNEYREGLVVFSVAMGIFIKTFVIMADLILVLLLLFLEIIFFISFLLWPAGTIFLLFS